MVNVPPAVRNILDRAEITPTYVRLPNEQLSRSLYQDVNDVLVAAGGRWDRKTKTHLFPTDPREKLQMAKTSGTIVSKKKELEQFFTPVEVADRVAKLADIFKGISILEPSAGAGALIAACIRAGAHPKDITGIEIDPELAVSTREMTGADIQTGDFLLHQTDIRYERIVMNPPFSGGQDVAHVTHALTFLAPDGILVAIMPPSWITGSYKRNVDFRNLIASYDKEIIELPAGSFKEADTGVNTVILVLSS